MAAWLRAILGLLCCASVLAQSDSPPGRNNRHALIIGLSHYADPALPPLPGTRFDNQSATQMAQAMQVPLGNIRYLRDEQATGHNIRQALQDLSDSVLDGDRVFIHFSGHGTRYNDPVAGGCVEALLAYEGGQSGVITNREMASLLKPMTNKADKLFVMYDACHSGGLVQAASSVRTRGLGDDDGNPDEGVLRPKFASISEECSRPANLKTRSLLTETIADGALPQDIVHLSASRDNEISFDDDKTGGLATQYVRDCMLRDAKDLDNSGAISMEEIRQCAQLKVNQRLANDPNFKPQNLVLNGNPAFVPAWFSRPSATAVVASAPVLAPVLAPAPAPLPVPAPAPTLPAIPATSNTPVKPNPPIPSAEATPPAPLSVATPQPLTGEQALRQLFDQRDAKRQVRVTLGKRALHIGEDALDFSVSSDRAGYVYVAMVGSDNTSVYLLFPNALDSDNKIEARQPLSLPRAHWRVKASGPAGTDNLLVVVADAPRDFSALPQTKAGPFLTSLNNAQGRAELGALMTASQAARSPACSQMGQRRLDAVCSDAFGAALVAVDEVK